MEMLMGIVGFFALMALIQTVVLEVRGDNALGSALLLAVLLLALWWVVRRWRSTRP
jgi:hypothetical protein